MANLINNNTPGSEAGLWLDYDPTQQFPELTMEELKTTIQTELNADGFTYTLTEESILYSSLSGSATFDRLIDKGFHADKISDDRVNYLLTASLGYISYRGLTSPSYPRLNKPLGSYIRINSSTSDKIVVKGNTLNYSWFTYGDLDIDSTRVRIELYDNDTLLSTLISSGDRQGSSTIDTSNLDASVDRYKIRITVIDNEEIYNDYGIAIDCLVPVLTLSEPNGSEVIESGSEFLIEWTSSEMEVTDNIKIELYNTNGTIYDSEIIASTPNTGSYTWNTTGIANRNDYRVRINKVGSEFIEDYSDASFEIADASITVIQPNGSEVLPIGNDYEIQWSSVILNPTENVKIDLYKGGIFDSEIVASTVNDGSYTWNTSGLTADTDYTIRVSRVSDSGIYDESDSTFELAAKTLTITLPNGSEEITVGDIYNITWTSENIAPTENIKLELYKADVYDSDIIVSTPNDGQYEWDTTGLTEATDYKVRIELLSDSSVYDLSDGNFSIVGAVPINYISFHKLDDNLATTNVVDETGNYNGTAQQNTNLLSVPGVKGIANTALSFNGSTDAVNIPQTGVGDELTISAWIKKDINSDGWIINRRSAESTPVSEKEWQIYFFSASSSFLNFALYNSSDTPFRVTFPSIPYTGGIGTWFHIAVTIASDKTIKTYVNGVIDNTGSYTGTMNTGATNTRFGFPGWSTLGNTSALAFDGSLDNTRLYNYALTPSQILAIYNEEKP